MRNLFLGTLIYFVIIIANLNAQSVVEGSGDNILDDTIIQSVNEVFLDTLVYKVYGMDCPGCHNALEKQINKLSAVGYSEANWVKQEVRIVVKKDSVINEEEIIEKIKKANFTPGERKID